ncbi:MAG: hypothetical protein J5744_08940 [Oscillospiraceae bacterium]|nr:hypothetical protein [Oscillospiraceae bacterium]
MEKRCLLLAFILFVFISAVFSTTVDLSSKTNDELTNLYQSVLTELLNRSVKKASTNNDTSSPILFRNMPWGTNYKTFTDLIRADGITGGSYYDSYASYSFEFDISDYGGVSGTYWLENSGYKYSNSSVKNLSVGGFPVSAIEAHFLFAHDDNAVYSEKDDCVLYKASYGFKVADGEATYSILEAKLASLYGKGTSKSASSGVWSTAGDYHVYTQCTVWYGADDTGVVLCREYQISDATNSLISDKVTLTYGKSNSLELFNDLKAAMAREELKKAINSNDLSGL